MRTSTLLVRADASVKTGTGHVMRCVALAQAWQDAGGRAVFAMAGSTPGLEERLCEESCEVCYVQAQAGNREDIEQTVAEARHRNADWVVVDGYQFEADFHDGLKRAGLKVLCVDDYGHASRYSADIILNQNPSASAALYPEIQPSTKLLLGPRYALLRHEFTRFRAEPRHFAPACRRLVILMGGSDPENVTVRAIEAVALARIDGLQATVLVGAANPHFEALRRAVGPQSGIKVIRDARNIPELMAEADLALSAAGSTCWELSFFGVPSLLVDVAENQKAVAKQLDRFGCAIHVGDQTVSAEELAKQLRRLCEDRELRSVLSERSRELVDGKGASRVASSMLATNGLRLRSVAAEDCRLLWEWANDPEVRASSFSASPIPWEDHVRWFQQKLADSGSRIFVAENESGDPIGQIRFDQRQDEDWEVDVSIAREMRGQGLAGELIWGAVERMQRELPKATIHAFVKPSNAASIKAFERAAFRRLGMEAAIAESAVHLVCEPVSSRGRN